MKRKRNWFGKVVAAAVWACMPMVVVAVDAGAPTIPGSFQATTTASTTKVVLSWEASSGEAGGISGYRLERSLDRQTWELVAESLVSLSYEDTGVGPGLRYFYRLRAVDGSGGVSGWATTEVETTELSAAQNSSDAQSFTSSDNIASVSLPAGATSGNVACKVAVISGINGKSPGTKEQPLVVGPYTLECKTTAGGVVSGFQKPATWQFKLKDHLKNLNDPAVYTYDAQGVATRNDSAHFDSQNQIITTTLAASSTVAVLATVPHAPSFTLFVVVLALVGLGFGLAMVIWNQQKKREYEEHLRNKYYDL
jgi:hypothetical protein